MSTKLLILDLDETLFHACEKLLLLMPYLEQLKEADNIRRMEKRSWRRGTPGAPSID